MIRKKEDKNTRYTVHISFATIVKTSLFLLLLYLLFFLKELVLVFLTSIVLASAIEPFIRRMEKIKVPRVFSVTIVYFFLIFLIIGLSVLFIPTIVEQANNFLKELPTHIENLNLWLDSKVGNSGVMVNAVDQLEERVSGFAGLVDGQEVSNGDSMNNFIITLFGGLWNFILVLVFSFYLAVQEHGIGKFLKIVTPAKYTKYALNLWSRTEKKISLWMQGQLMISLIVGALTYFGLVVFFDFEQALLLAFLAALSELIPIIGPFIAAVPAVIVGVMSGGWALAIPVALFYTAIQFIEAQMIYPMVVKKVVGVPSILVILSLVIGVQLFGFLGVIIAIPVAAALMEYVKDIDKRQEEALKRGEEEEVDLSKKTS